MITVTTEPDMSIEPGHQWIVIKATQGGAELARIIAGEFWVKDGIIRVPHTAEVDQKIVSLIDQLAHVRFSAPDLIQLNLIEMPVESLR